MLRFLYSTDWHIKGKNPATRTDDYPETIESKIRDYFRLGQELNVDAFLAGGDYFDSPHTASEVVTRFGKIIQEELKGKQLYGVWGNHDEIGWNPKSVKKVSIGVFEEFSNFFHILDRTPFLFKGSNGETVKLSGISAYPQLDKHIFVPDTEEILEHRSRDYVIEETDGTPHIHIVHGYLSPQPILETINHTVISEMKHTKATVTLTAHEHGGFPVTETDNGLVYNPGGLGRVHASYTEMNRMPKYALVTIHSDGRPEIEPIQCRVAKPGKEVMSRERIEEKAQKEAVLSVARDNIKEVIKGINIKGIDLNVILNSYQDKLKPKVFEEAKKRLKL